ncbi:efflux RND transporter periplasmic adaptor subunit [Desulfopila sp. IMCC35008]|uniref:efflux RND transporter periplasmic adaptor subunit n=1 Tax=Desulfopila sp. IMCC35008 TaxID=2653858 RepID=UPI0013D0B04B|nr:efflux RND transporter periplasmic adaptor subunit [Desulfopila sp. IMCC35008]
MKSVLSIIFFAIGLAALLSTSGCNSEHQKGVTTPQLPAQEVRVAQAILEPVRNQIELLGTIEPVNRVEIAAKVSGSIIDLPVVLGSEIEKGELLVEISAGEIDAQLQQSKAQLDQARRNLDRERKLLSQKAATRESVRALQEGVEIAEAAYTEALTFQQYTSIKAPINGRVTRKHVNKGDLATPGKPLLNIEDNKHLQVITDIPERYIFQIKQGDKLQVEVPSAEMTITGSVAEVAPNADPQTRTAPIKLDIEADEKLYGGQFVRVALNTKEVQTLTIPQSALVPIGQMERVFVVEEDIAKLRLVRSGEIYGDSIEILSGLKEGERVVIEGQETITDGQPVILR